MLGHTSGVSYSQQNKDKRKYKRTFGNELVSTSNEMPHSTKEYSIYVIFYLQLTWFIYSTFSEFNNCRVLIALRVTIHNICSKYSPPESLHEWTLLIVDCSTLSKVLERLRMVLQASEMPWWRLSSLSVGDEYTRSFSVPTNKHINYCEEHVLGLYLENNLLTYIDMNCVRWFVVGNSFL